MSEGTNRNDFLIEELKGLREKVNAALGEARALERYAVLLTGGVWAWLLTSDNNLPKLSWWIPFIGSCLLLLREMVIHLEVRALAEYIRRQEEDFLGKNDGGWETKVARSAFAIRGLRVPWAALTFWGVLISTTFIGPFLLTKGDLFMDLPENLFDWSKWSAIANVVIAITTVILAIIAIFGRTISRWIRRPKLAVEALSQVPHCRKTFFVNNNTGEVISDVYYFRILVKNNGKSSASNVEVYASQLLKKKRDGTYTIISSFTPDNLLWSNINKGMHPIIPPKSERHCCVFHILDPAKRNDPRLKPPMAIAEDKVFPDIPPEKTIMHVDTKFKSSRKDYLQPCGDYLLEIIVSASNSSSVVRKSISIDITGDWYGDEDQMLKDGVGFRIV